MNLTEPQAGSDVGAVRSRAEPADDGTYRSAGRKSSSPGATTTWRRTSVHLVLARLPDGRRGRRGISLFLVPKLLPDAEGGRGVRNGVRALSLEHKMGLHGSPTCVWSTTAPGLAGRRAAPRGWRRCSR